MKKPLLLSLAVASLIATNLSAESMYERFEAMEKEMNKLKQEIAELKAAQTKPKTIKPAAKVAASEEKEDDEDSEDEKAVKKAPAIASADAKNTKEDDEEDSLEDRL
ncbi:MAG: hypothetical protein QG559_608, partial [Campylobacterota bacterium]|nr:hypothetical protein [Campylobacterota bacterium]